MWSWDFLSDRTDNDGKLRILSVSVAEARVVIEDYRWYYNEVRPHGGIGYRTPAQACREAQVPDAHPASVLRQELDLTPETDTCTI